MSTFINLTAADDDLALVAKTIVKKCAWLRTVPARHMESGDDMEIFNPAGRKTVVNLTDVRAEGKSMEEAAERLGERLGRHPPPRMLLLPTIDQCPIGFEDIAGWTVINLRIGFGY
jgi:hypothetical protein